MDHLCRNARGQQTIALSKGRVGIIDKWVKGERIKWWKEEVTKQESGRERLLETDDQAGKTIGGLIIQ